MASEGLFNRIQIQGHEFHVDPQFGIKSEVLTGFSVEAVECVLDFLHTKLEKKAEFVVKPQIALEVLKLAQHWNIN